MEKEKNETLFLHRGGSNKYKRESQFILAALEMCRRREEKGSSFASPRDFFPASCSSVTTLSTSPPSLDTDLNPRKANERTLA